MVGKRDPVRIGLDNQLIWSGLTRAHLGLAGRDVLVIADVPTPSTTPVPTAPASLTLFD